MVKHFKLIPFIGGLIIGFFILKVFNRENAVVYDYPHPDTVNNRIYKDKNGTCYAYSANEVNCDSNEKNLKMYPLQS